MRGGTHKQRLFLDCAAAAYPLARETTAPRPLSLTGLTDHASSASAGQPAQQSQGAPVARFDPEVISLNVVAPLSNEALLLGMTILVEQDSRRQQALLVQHHEYLARQGGRPGATPGLEALLGRGHVMASADFHLIARQPPRVTCSPGFAPRLRQRGGVAHERSGHAGCDTLQLGVQGGGCPPIASVWA